MFKNANIDDKIQKEKKLCGFEVSGVGTCGSVAILLMYFKGTNFPGH